MARLRTLSQISFFCSISLALFLLFSLLTSSPIREAFVIHEAIQQIPSQLIYHGPAHHDHQLTLTLSLSSTNVSGLEYELDTISDPKYPNYGNHMTKEQVQPFIQPDPQALASVVKWLNSNGLTGTPALSGNNLKMSLPVSRANGLFNANFSFFNDTRSGRQLVRTEQYSLPGSLSAHIRAVYPTVPRIPKQLRSPPAAPSSRMLHSRRDDLPGNCSTAITPQCVASFYNVPASLLQQSNSSSRMGILSNDDTINPRSVDMYLKTVHPDLRVNDIDIEIVTLSNAVQSIATQDDSSSSEDAVVMSMLGLTPRIALEILAASDDSFTQVDDLLELDTLPSVLVLYTATDESQFGDHFAQLYCEKFMQLAARGVTVLTGASQSEDCTLSPQLPSSCPHVTALGGTDRSNQRAVGNSQGTFSNFIPMPSYQQKVVQKYIDQNSIGNKSSRATPDLAVVADNVFSIAGTTPVLEGGLLYSVAFFAAMIAAINTQRMDEGKSSLGSLNPLLYSNMNSVFNDITQGELSCKDGGPITATAGWDPLSGLGTPDISSLLEVLN